jgi:alcohol dehydrogenase
VNLDFIPEGARATGLSAIMAGAGKLTRYIPIPTPTLLVGPGSSARMASAVAGFGHKHVLIVTDAMIVKLGLLKGITDALDAAGTRYTVFDEITPDAPIPLIERGMAAFRKARADAIIAVGGGSSMDASKAIAIACANSGKHLRDLAGYFKGFKSPCEIYAVPTTAGTGSEVTVAAVIADRERHSKLVIVDPRLVPKMAALDAALMVGLPAPITAATGMDALTHAVESFVGQWATPYTNGMALAATGMIFENLRTACTDGKNLAARENMALAATYAGIAFTRANVGYVHAIAHQFGGKYHTPHGLANAIMLPHVLKFSLSSIRPQLAELAKRAKIGSPHDSVPNLADAFVAAVEQMNADIGIPTTLGALQEKDIPALAKAACHEAETGYPVPRYMTQAQCEAVIRKALPPKGSEASTGASKPVAKAAPKAVKKAAPRKKTA